jgi:hypothetical protein
MIALVHGALGAACGTLLERRRPTVVAALVSHFVADAVNHEEPLDQGGNLRLRVITLDALLLGLALLLLWIRRGIFSSASLGAVAACLPDVDYFLLGSAVHKPFPHGRWPSRKIAVWWQFSMGTIAWLALLGCPSADDA